MVEVEAGIPPLDLYLNSRREAFERKLSSNTIVNEFIKSQVKKVRVRFRTTLINQKTRLEKDLETLKA